MKDVQAIILAAGRGTRLKELTKITPKPLLQIGEKTLIEHIIYFVKAIGISDITVVGGYLFDQLQRKVKFFFPDIKVVYNSKYFYQNLVSFKEGLKIVDDKKNLLVCNADYIFSKSIAEAVSQDIKDMKGVSVYCSYDLAEDDEDVMKVLEECLVFILKSVKKNCKEQLKTLKRKIEIPELPFKRITYSNAIDLLQKHGDKIKWGEDFSKTQERTLSKLVGKVFFIKDWPTKLKAFYAMPYEDNPKICHAFDLIFEGLEIASGTQRIHKPELLIKQIKAKGLNPENFKFYIDCFRYGSPYHSGWSIGLERLSMKICGKENIREVTMFPRDRNRITP